MPPFFRPLAASLAPSLGTASGHLWTLSSFVGRAVVAPRLSNPEPFDVQIQSDLGLPAVLRGSLHDVTVEGREHRPLVVLIHGLGGSAESGNVRQVARIALDLGLSTLRLSLRGADDSGWDFYHAGLTDDIIAVLGSPQLDVYDSIYILGLSLGGHVTLRAAGDARLPSHVRAVAALCPPLDLEASAAAFDTPGQWIYRGHVLRGLKAMYRRFLSHASNTSATMLPNMLARLQLPDARGVETISKIREWDERIVSRRHGFDSATEYYHSQRASTRLHELRVPSLIVTTRWDPMVPHATTNPALEQGTALASLHAWNETRVNSSLVHWQLPSGGHVAWPAQGEPRSSVVHHMLEWLARPEGL